MTTTPVSFLLVRNLLRSDTHRSSFGKSVYLVGEIDRRTEIVAAVGREHRRTLRSDVWIAGVATSPDKFLIDHKLQITVSTDARIRVPRISSEELDEAAAPREW